MTGRGRAMTGHGPNVTIDRPAAQVVTKGPYRAPFVTRWEPPREIVTLGPAGARVAGSAAAARARPRPSAP